MKRDLLDLHEVPPSQAAMHERLINWGRWCNGRGADGRGYPESSPMFKQYRPDKFEVIYEAAASPVDQADAGKIQAAVVLMAVQSDDTLTMAKALSWFYVKPVSPGRAARELRLPVHGLAQRVIDGRALLMRRGV